MNILGANITTPFKELIIDYLDDISDEVKGIGAVNLILNNDGELKGYNTDYLGLTRTIYEAGLSLNGAKCLVLGAGGAARAAVYGLIEEQAKVYIANRTAAKAEDMSVYFGCEVFPFDQLNSKSMNFDIVISALLPDVELPLNWDCGCKLFIDANYRKSRMGEVAAEKGLRVIKGDRWLINQAVAAYNLFTGVNPDTRLFEEAFSKGLDYQNIKVGIIKPEEIRTFTSIDFDLIAPSEHLANYEKSLL